MEFESKIIENYTKVRPIKVISNFRILASKNRYKILHKVFARGRICDTKSTYYLNF